MGKIVITGGSGFVGTNLVESYAAQGWEILNLDLVAPLNPAQMKYWKRADIRDEAAMTRALTDFSPSHILHMAARTDLDGTTLESYSSNIEGVSTLIKCSAKLSSLERVIFTSSQYVHRLGYIPRDEFDYNPHTVYGESKVIGEKLVREFAADRFPWTIMRPTSLWGPWFDVPYRDFFEAVKRGRYMHPRDKVIRRSYGFVLNAVRQMQQVASHPNAALVNKQVFYLADYLPTDLYQWAGLISREFGVKSPRQVPYALLKTIALGGDLLKVAGVKKVPLSTFRLNNLMTDVVYDMSPLLNVAGPTEHNLEAAVIKTVDWMKAHPQRNKHG